MGSFTFPKNARLLKSADFDRVFIQRCSQSDRLIVVYAARNDVESARLGLVVSRKVGNAVVRNRWKRALREAFRLTQHELPKQLDLVVVPRQGAKPDVADLKNSLIQLAHRAARRLDTDVESSK